MVAKSRATRLFLPTAFKLDRAATADKATYPEYDKLFGGGTDPKALTVALVVGRLSHEIKGLTFADFVQWTVYDKGYPAGTYQLFFFDSCVSYNYYEKDFFTLERRDAGQPART
jgi:hypothetical protein